MTNLEVTILNAECENEKDTFSCFSFGNACCRVDCFQQKESAKKTSDADYFIFHTLAKNLTVPWGNGFYKSAP